MWKNFPPHYLSGCKPLSLEVECCEWPIQPHWYSAITYQVLDNYIGEFIDIRIVFHNKMLELATKTDSWSLHSRTNK